MSPEKDPLLQRDYFKTFLTSLEIMRKKMKSKILSDKLQTVIWSQWNAAYAKNVLTVKNGVWRFAVKVPGHLLTVDVIMWTEQ